MTRQWPMAMLAVGVISGCSRPNPDFGEGGTRDTATNVGTSDETDATSAEVTTGPGSGMAGSGKVDDSTTSEPTSGGTTEANTGPDTTGETEGSGGMVGACEAPMFIPRYEITLPEFVFGSCPPMRVVTISVEQDNDTSMHASMCPFGCFCAKPLLFEVNVDVPMPALDGCIDLVLDFREDGPSCVVDAYAFAPEGVGQAPPSAIVSNVVDPEFLDPFEFELEPEPLECMSECMPRPMGYYDLLTAGGVSVPMGNPGVDVDVYQVLNEASGVHEGCGETARWRARQVM